MIKAIVFDLGRVLVNININNGILSKLGITDVCAISKLADNPYFVAYSTGKIAPNEFYDNVKETFNLAFSYEEFKKIWCNIFFEMEGMNSLVEALSKKYPLGLLSDTDPLHWGHILKQFPWISKYFKSPTLSFEIGVMKPDKFAFEKAVASVGFEPKECIFIDDLQKNIIGAKSFGMHGILFKNKDDLIKKLEYLCVKI